jgi:hypothetical protein
LFQGLVLRKGCDKFRSSCPQPLDGAAKADNLFELIWRTQMPELVKMYIRNVLIGFGIAAAFVAVLLWFNVMNLWSLVTASDAGLLAVFLLWFMHGIVFAGVQFAWAVMAMAEKGTGPRRGTPVVDAFQPVKVPAEKPSQAQRQLRTRR